MKPITPCLWFDTEGEDAAKLYTSIIPNSRITDVNAYGVSFELNGQPYFALNGGPQYTFSEAVSFQIFCESQEEVDRYWEALGEGGEPGPCGWLKDRFGLSWQIVPTRLTELLSDPDRERAQRVAACMMKMGKLEIAELEAA
jgi:predicted 3-demethylubiquinone-9 3-methyltransferase (glyoxalase superfamily)